jgi:hypothetical protein
MMTTVEVFEALGQAAKTEGRLVTADELLPDGAGDTAIAKLLERQEKIGPMPYHGLQLSGSVAVRGAVAVPGAEIPRHEEPIGAAYLLHSTLVLQVPGALEGVDKGAHEVSITHWLRADDPQRLDDHFLRQIPERQGQAMRALKAGIEAAGETGSPRTGRAWPVLGLLVPEILASERADYGPNHERMNSTAPARAELIRHFLLTSSEDGLDVMFPGGFHPTLVNEELKVTVGWLLRRTEVGGW